MVYGMHDTPFMADPDETSRVLAGLSSKNTGLNVASNSSDTLFPCGRQRGQDSRFQSTITSCLNPLHADDQ
jgi:hypothetical protein